VSDSIKFKNSRYCTVGFGKVLRFLFTLNEKLQYFKFTTGRFLELLEGRQKYQPLKGTVSRDWGELLMVEIDKTHLFNVAGEGFYLILSAFS